MFCINEIGKRFKVLMFSHHYIEKVCCKINRITKRIQKLLYWQFVLFALLCKTSMKLTSSSNLKTVLHTILEVFDLKHLKNSQK